MPLLFAGACGGCRLDGGLCLLQDRFSRGGGLRRHYHVDYRTGHGSMILGQAHPAIAAAVHRQMDKGTHLGASTELELRWASLVRRLAPSVEKIRFHSSGTEADMMALKMARVFTGKTKIIKFRDGFHGWSDAASVRDPDRDRQFGIPPETAASVIVLPDGDLDAVERTLEQRDDIAAVILQGDEIIRPESVHVSLGREVDTSDEFAMPTDSPGSSAGVRSNAVPLLQLALVNEGLWTTPLKFFLSAVHTPDEIDETVARYEAALFEVRKTGAV